MATMKEKLAHLKRQSRYTADDLYHMTGVSSSTIYKISSGVRRNPSMEIIDKLAKAFGVPPRYLIDDSIPIEYDLAAFCDYAGIFAISPSEIERIKKYRSLTDHGKKTVDGIIDELLRQAPGNSQEQYITLPCYYPIASGNVGVYGDAFKIRLVKVPARKITLDADFITCVTSDTLEPIYPPGTYLSVVTGEAKHNQLGLFVLNGEALVRRLYNRNGVKMFCSINVDYENIKVKPEDEFRCMGIILGSIRI